MKAVIPAAGIGKRLRPHTYTVPKALLNVGGKTILGHIIDGLKAMDIDEIIPIIGYKGELIREYLEDTCDIPLRFVVQEEQKGIAHAVSMTRDYADNSELVIILGDTIVKTDFGMIPRKGDYVLGVHEVENPSRFGICEVKDNIIKSIVEKPEEPKSNLAIIGVYYFKDSSLLYETCYEIIEKGITTKGEFQITDALQMMVKKGINFHPYNISGWYDCGKVETLLETNRILLDETSQKRKNGDAIIIEPCYIHEESKIENAIIGPYVSIAKDCDISYSIIRNSIINENSSIKRVIIEDSVVGACAEITGRGSSFNVGDHSQVCCP